MATSGGGLAGIDVADNDDVGWLRSSFVGSKSVSDVFDEVKTASHCHIPHDG